MVAISFAIYFLYAYAFLPLFYVSISTLYSNRFQICPLVKCIRPLIQCVREPECKELLDKLHECNDETSEARRRSAASFSHVQHPEDPSFCRYQCFDTISTQTALDLLECIGSSGCLEPSVYTDICASIEQPPLPFETIQSVLSGQWAKLYTTGWDTWPCQWTFFQPPHASSPAPDPWMNAWPTTPNVWRMDLYWNNVPPTVTFHMSNEMYPHDSWSFPTQPVTARATLKTRAVMWGTEAHENWYLLHYDASTQTMLVYYCAYTEAIHRFDSMAMVLQKKDADRLTEEAAHALEEKALQMLGETHGRLQRIKECPQG